MNPLRNAMLRVAACAAFAIGTAGATGDARADAFAQSILVIDNFRMLHANGTPYTASDFSMLAGASVAHASGQLNGVFASDVQSGAGASGLDVAHQSVGMGLPARAENNFVPLSGLPAAPGNFGYADQQMAGTMITTSTGAAGALIQSRADASLTASGSATGNSGVGGATSFSFSLGSDEYMTIAFDALPFTQAYASGGAGLSTGANAHLSWSISVLDLTTGATVFAFQPEQLNALSDVSRTDGLSGATTYDPGRLSFSATTGMLTVGDTYQVTIAPSTISSAMQSQQMPEPATLAGFGAGLLAMAALSRRRRD
jgi:hypothetical protein